MTNDQIRAALILQAQAINLAFSTLVALAHGDGVDDLAKRVLEKAARDFRQFSDRLREKA